jgi:hypothetical protein
VSLQKKKISKRKKLLFSFFLKRWYSLKGDITESNVEHIFLIWPRKGWAHSIHLLDPGVKCMSSFQCGAEQKGLECCHTNLNVAGMP